MHVLLVTQYYWPESFIIDSLALRLQELGHKVTVLTGKPNYPDGVMFPGYKQRGIMRETHDGIDIIRIPILGRGKAPRSGLRLALNYLSFVFSGLTVGLRATRNIPYDVVFVYAPSPLTKAIPAMLYARRRKAPLAVWVQDLWPESLAATGLVKNQLLIKLVEMVVRVIYRSSDLILVQSRSFIEPVVALALNREKVRYFPNFYKVPDQIICNQRTQNIIRRLHESFSVVFAGNLGTAQAPETIVEAATHLLAHPGINLYLVGSGSMGAWIAEQKEARGLHNLHLTGRVQPQEIPAILEAATALLTTLKSDTTFDMTIPSKVQAYLACGRPIIASMNGEGASVILQAQAGLCSKAGDSQALAENILRLKRMPTQELTTMGKNGRQYYEEHFKLEVLADILSNQLSELIESHQEK